MEKRFNNENILFRKENNLKPHSSIPLNALKVVYDNVLFQSKGILSPKKLLFKKHNQYKEETLKYLERWC